MFATLAIFLSKQSPWSSTPIVAEFVSTRDNSKSVFLALERCPTSCNSCMSQSGNAEPSSCVKRSFCENRRCISPALNRTKPASVRSTPASRTVYVTRGNGLARRGGRNSLAQSSQVPKWAALCAHQQFREFGARPGAVRTPAPANQDRTGKQNLRAATSEGKC